MGWFAAIVAFYFAKRLIAALAENDGQEIVHSILSLFAYPFAVAAAPGVTAVLSKWLIHDVGRKAIEISSRGSDVAMRIADECGVSASLLSDLGEMDVIVVTILMAVVTFVLAIGASLLARLISECIGTLSIPKGLHRAVVRILEVLSSVCSAVLGISAVKFVDAKICALPFWAKLLTAIAIGFFLMRSLRRIFSSPPPTSRTAKVGAAKVKSLAQRPDVRLSDVMGMEQAKEQIRLRLIEPLRDPARAKRYGLKIGGGVLLYGPPGTGKTMLARAVAGELALPFFTFTSADILGMYVGESEKNIRRIFAEIRKNSLSVVFIDELETIFPKRTSDIHETTRHVISILLQELDGLDQQRNPILLLGATNVPWMVDGAFLRPGRFDEKIFVDLPDETVRRKIIDSLFSRSSIPCKGDIVGYLAAKTDGYSGADLNGIINRLSQLAYANRSRYYTLELAQAALDSVPPSVDTEQLAALRNW